MKIKANIDGRIYERAVKKFQSTEGTNFSYIVVNNAPYIVLMHDGQPNGIITLNTFLDSVSGQAVTA